MSITRGSATGCRTSCGRSWRSWSSGLMRDRQVALATGRRDESVAAPCPRGRRIRAVAADGSPWSWAGVAVAIVRALAARRATHDAALRRPQTRSRRRLRRAREELVRLACCRAPASQSWLPARVRVLWAASTIGAVAIRRGGGWRLALSCRTPARSERSCHVSPAGERSRSARATWPKGGEEAARLRRRAAARAWRKRRGVRRAGALVRLGRVGGRRAALLGERGDRQDAA